ncbi:MAG: rRNA maturation RNase YbeY [Fimbriiglobus sp.]
MISLSVANPYEYELDFAVLKAAAKTVLEGEAVKSAKVVLAFVNNEHIHRLNKQFLNHDEPTDVITFPYTDHKSKKLEGEIVIGYEVAQEYAADRGHDTLLELQLYVIHGCLHLTGYDDVSPKDEKEMRARERHYLKLLNLPDIAGA